jgi:uncharacterized protein (DUF885 family)
MTRRELLAGSLAAQALNLNAQSTGDAKFVAVANGFLEKYLEHTPEYATFVGEHRYDGRLSDVSKSGIDRDTETARDALKQLEAIPPESLNAANRLDQRILTSKLQREIWGATVLREHEWNPIRYNPGSAIYILLERDFAPLPKRLESVRLRLDAIPAFLSSAMRNLENAPRIHTETAALQNKGTINLIRTVLGNYLDKSPEMRASVAPAQARAIAALQEWGQWLEKDLLPRATRDFRIGPEMFRAKLRYTLESDLSPDDIRTRAGRELTETQNAMYDTAAGLAKKLNLTVKDAGDRKLLIRSVLDKLAESRPKADTIVAHATRELAGATDFVRRHHLVSVYDTPLRVVEMPEFQRGVAVASCASPGPLEKNGITFFNISPPPAQWSADQVDSYFRENNDFMLREMTVHEAMPGHYLQFAHANRFHAPTLLRGIFWSGTFVEGWAVYAEKLMAEQGYGGPEVRMQQLKMRLRLITNALIDQEIHAAGMTEQQAMDLMMNEGFQERSEAAGKWRRACLTSTQLSTYYVGSTELFQLREDYQKKFGVIKDWKTFHDRMLSFGSPAPRYVRELMGV